MYRKTEFRIYGPPGAGKTTYLSRQTGRAAQACGPESVLVTSLTRTAAAEIASRGVPIPAGNIGTLHSFAYRALGCPDVAESKAADWNAANPHYALTVKSSTAVDDSEETRSTRSSGQRSPDKILATMQALRARMTPEAAWPGNVRRFARAWKAWKTDNDYIDFTDMLELAYHDTEAPAFVPRVMIVDEAQDFSHLGMRLVRHWGKRSERVIIAGDPDQALFSWAGADPGVFSAVELPEDQVRILGQSYRVPRAVHGVAMSIIKQHGGRKDIPYKARDADGLVRRIDGRTLGDPRKLVGDVKQQVEAGRSVMVLASCGYILRPIIDELRDRAIPYHNPYRRTHRGWNPLSYTAGKVSPVSRLLAYMRPDKEVWGKAAREWDTADLRQWVEVVSAGALQRGTKARVKQMPKAGESLSLEDLASLFRVEEDFLEAAAPDMAWFIRHLMTTQARKMRFPAEILRQHGASALFDRPQVCIGTVHSVKGGEADVVYILPDLSNQGAQAWVAHGDRRDEIIRQFYVGVTRAREELVLCGATGKATVNLW